MLDPKYKLDSEDLASGQETDAPSGEPKKVDIDKMHAYRDAIRNPSGCGGVTLAAILYPGQDRAYGAHLHAISARPRYAQSLTARLRHLFLDHLGPADPTPSRKEAQDLPLP